MPSLTMSAPEARELLGLQPGYGKAELSVAYRRLVRSVHPDLLVDAPEDEVRAASDRLAEANLANEVLQRSIRLNASDPAPATDVPAEARAAWTPSAPTSSQPTFTAPSGRRSAESRRRWFSVFPAR